MADVLALDMRDVRFAYGDGANAVDGVSLRIAPGQSLGLVGESGCGKSTIARLACGLLRARQGEVQVSGLAAGQRKGPSRLALARAVQMVFQDPYGSLNPRQRIGAQLAEPLRLHGSDAAGPLSVQVREWLERVGLPAAVAERYPHELSGGQRQRVAIARAVAVQPYLLVCDEPVSALDVSVQAQILNLLRDLRETLGLACLFISHDLRVVRYMAETIAVMQHGRIVEMKDTDQLWQAAEHPYTRQLLASLPPDL
jgi:ABC-type glutathione transport system ATPase component